MAKTIPSVILRKAVQTALTLSDDDLAESLPSGMQSKFSNRLAWASVYLSKAGVLKRVRRGVFQITERGRELLGENPEKVTVKMLSRYPEFIQFHKGSEQASGATGQIERESSETPEERLASDYQILREALAAELLDATKKSPPAFFERLVIELLVAMGYGGSAEEAGKVVGRGGDGGIDGIIKEDKLGLDAVYVQAKRWSGTVGRPIVQAFAGSLEGHRARKGVLITTSEFSADALDYVQKIEKKIVLVNGKQLAEFMIDYDIGVTAGKTYSIKKIDVDYFEES
jgi:restriction system protein